MARCRREGFEEWLAEVGREIAIDHHHIADLGFPALGFAVVIGTLIYLLR
jgi:hypothetical protein